MDCSHLRVVPRDPHQAVAGFARPADNISALDEFSAYRIKHFVGCPLGIGRIRINGVTISTQRQAQLGIDHVADGEDHGVHIQIGGFVGGFGGDVSIPLCQNVFRHREPADASLGILMDGLGRTEEAEEQPFAR